MQTTDSTEQPKRIAMWSGPRSLSTALMRAWENRSDTYVCDEPLYAHFLLHSGRADPNADEVLAHYETNWRKVVQELTGPVPEGKTIYFQKHMAHHLIEPINWDWIKGLTNCFLIRQPSEMLTSLIRLVPQATLRDTGLPRLKKLFEKVRDLTGEIPPVIDAHDLQNNPHQTISVLCQAVGVSFSDAMLNWPMGRRETDNIQAKYWYNTVEQTAHFLPHTPKDDAVPEHLLGVLEECNSIYSYLYAYRLQGTSE